MCPYGAVLALNGPLPVLYYAHHIVPYRDLREPMSLNLLSGRQLAVGSVKPKPTEPPNRDSSSEVQFEPAEPEYIKYLSQIYKKSLNMSISGDGFKKKLGTST